MMVQNLLTFVCNPLLGSYSDTYGRRPLLLGSLFLNALVPVSVVGLQVYPSLNPIVYYAIQALSGVVSYTTMVFAILADSCDPQFRSGRFATNLAAFYGGFAVAPSLAVYC